MKWKNYLENRKKVLNNKIYMIIQLLKEKQI